MEEKNSGKNLSVKTLITENDTEGSFRMENDEALFSYEVIPLPCFMLLHTSSLVYKDFGL